jgi:aspartate/methionine/tyrosine aminotransferase
MQTDMPADASPIYNPARVVTRHIDRLLKAGHIDPVPLGGSPHVELPTHVRTAAGTLASSSYVDSRGTAQLRQAIAETLGDEGIDCVPEQVLITNGAMHGLEIVFSTLLQPGDAVLMPQPGYFVGGLVKRTGATLQAFASPAADSYRPDWGAARKAVTAATKILYINTPVNPTGYVYTDEDLACAWAMATEFDLTIVSDESYSRFTYQSHTHRSISDLDPEWSRTILVRSFSKDYALSGWRLGFLVLPDALTEEMASHLEWSCLCVSAPAQRVGIAALQGPQDWVTQIRLDASHNAPIVAPLINRIPGLTTVAPKGGLNVLVSYDGDVDRLVRYSITELGLGIQPGAAFGAPKAFRFQFGGTEAAIRTGIERLGTGIRFMNQRGKVAR